MTTTLRIHPAIGISRVGNSDHYILSPESAAGEPTPNAPDIAGGLPLKPEAPDQPVTDADLRDDQHRLKPHAQRFRIFAYSGGDGGYPFNGEAQEITVGSIVDGKEVASITWQVHVANKKANNWLIPEDSAAGDAIGGMAHYARAGTGAYRHDITPGIRNPLTCSALDGKGSVPVDGKNAADAAATVDVLSQEQRLKVLMIDAGPKVIRSGAGGPVGLDAASACQYLDSAGQVQMCADYPVSFPGNGFSDLAFPEIYQPTDQPLETLGRIEVDAEGRLIVVGAPGVAVGWNPASDANPDAPISAEQQGQHFPMDGPIDNDGWFDDASDGPVYAALSFTDGTTRRIDVPAWVVCTDPSFAPQVRNIVTIWDEVYDSWLRKMGLDPDIYSGASEDGDSGAFNPSAQAAFDVDIHPIFRAAHLQMFTTDLNQTGISAHARLDAVTAMDNPADYLNVASLIRNPRPDPDNTELAEGAPKMPLALGDVGASFLTVTQTQYFFLTQWYDKAYVATESQPLSAGEKLDRDVMKNLLGGRFSPGIDLTFIVRDPMLYRQDWQDPAVGPFRIAAEALDYSSARQSSPFLSVGYTPNRLAANSVQPGDLSKFLALPWHADYNSCAIHQPNPNPDGNYTLFWSWPAQRPVSVYTHDDYVANDNSFYAKQRFSVRGDGTQVAAADGQGNGGMANVGKYQEYLDMVQHWMDIGVVIQSGQIEGFDGDNKDLFLETVSQLKGGSDIAEPWPLNITDKVYTE